MRYHFHTLTFALFMFLMPGPLWAHSVYIFAWFDGEQICTESYFTKSSKVRGGEVVMQGVNGETLGKGVTDQEGLLCFPLPDKAQSLEFSVLAGAGHKGSFILEKHEVAAALSASAQTGQDTAQGHKADTPAPEGQTEGTAKDYPANTKSTPEGTTISEPLLRQIVREELRRELGPLRQYLAEKLEDKTPGFKDIVGGIGWLLGLGALGFWYSQTRKKQ